MNSNNIKYSFVIPFWNLEFSYLERMISTIPHTQDVQILVFDDGSDTPLSSESIKLLEEDSCVEYISFEKHIGLGRIRNLSLDYVKGEWLIYADADDYYNKDILLDALKKISAQTDYDVVYWGARKIFKSGRIFDDLYGFNKSEEIIEIKDRSFLLNHRCEVWRKIVRTSWLREHVDVRNTEIILAQDVYYSIKMLLTANLVGLYPQLIYNYERREGSDLDIKWKYSDFKVSINQIIDCAFLLKKNKHLLGDFGPKELMLNKSRLYSPHLYIWYTLRFMLVDKSLFPKDFTQVLFNTQESNFNKALIAQCRVWLGAIRRKIMN